MQIQALNTRRTSHHRNNVPSAGPTAPTPITTPSFRATPKQIADKALEKARARELCPSKAKLLVNVAGFFDKIQEQLAKATDAPKEFVYNVGKKNEIPESIKKINVNGGNLEELDKELNEGAFSCGSNPDDKCGEGESLGEFVSSLLHKIGVPEPDTIKISKP